MSRFRTPLAALAPAVAALFALSVAAPRSGWVHHHHAGGERTHVHAEDELAGLVAEILAHRHAHDDGTVHEHHRPHRSRAAAARSAVPHGAELNRADDGDAGHSHQRQLFQRAVVPDVAYVAAVAAAGTAVQTAPPRIDRAAVHASHARAPPAPRFSDC